MGKVASELPSKRKCRGVDCDNEAEALQCPACLKMGMEDSFFCSQDCFKKNWVGLPLMVTQTLPLTKYV